MSVRFSALRTRLIVSFDAYDWQNDNRRGIFRRVHAAETNDAPLIGELDNGAHLGGPALSAACWEADPMHRRDKHRRATL